MRVEISEKKAEERELVDRLDRRGGAVVIDPESVANDSARSPTDANRCVPPIGVNGRVPISTQTKRGVEVSKDRDSGRRKCTAGNREPARKPRTDGIKRDSTRGDNDHAENRR